MPADCIEKVVCLQRDELLNQRIPTPRPAPKIALKDAWQVEQGKLSNSERSTAEGHLFKSDPRIQGISHNAVLEDQGIMTKIRELVKKKNSEQNTDQNLSLPT